MIEFPKPDVEELLQTVSIINFAVSPDEKQLIFCTNLSGKYNLWAMDLPNAFPYRLTFNNQLCHELLYDREGRFVLAGFDHDGDENTQFYALKPHGGALKRVVYQENTRNFSLQLSNDGERLYYSSSKENPSYLNSYCLQLSTGEETTVLEGSGGTTYITEVSEDETTILYSKFFLNTNTLYYARVGDEDILLTPRAEKEHTVSSAVLTSPTEVYLVTDYEGDFSYLAKFDLESKTFTKVKEIPKEGFKTLTYDKENRILYIIAEKGVEDRLYAYHLNDGTWENILIPCDLITKVAVAESGTVYLLGRGSVQLGNVYKREGDEWVQITRNKMAGMAAEDFVAPEVVTYPSFDGLEIEALFYKAKEEHDKGEVILWPHGGPQHAERKSFNAILQYFLSNGYSIFAPNFRGSTGYGLSFTKMVERAWGAGARLDNIAGLDWLIEQGYAKKGEFIVMGGSYGGYMSLLLHGRHADYFKAVVDICGPSNLFSFINSVPEDWKPVMDTFVGHPERDREKLIEYSPDTYVDQMTKPMLVVQGANDPRVVKAESDQIVEALKEKGRDITYIVMEDEGHGFAKRENEIAVFRQVLEFMEKYASKPAKVH